MRTVLSTKKLEPHQKHLLLNSGIALVEYNTIKIEFLDFEVASTVENAIITSKNAARAIIKKQISIAQCFCVGDHTANYMKTLGFYVQETAHYGKDLANIIVAKYPKNEFVFFCGNKRREELPEILKEHQIKLKEATVYKTSLHTKNFRQEFDGILFFSPSAVQGFVAENSMKSAIAFCIGDTTASEAKQHTQDIIIATKPSIENVIVQVVKKFKQ